VLFCPQNNYSTFAQPFQWVCRLLLAKKIGDFMNNHDEIQPDSDAYNQINAALKQAKAANMGGRSEEGTSVEL
jgi:hypothetical protein